MSSNPSEQIDAVVEVQAPTYRQLFEPCAVDECSDCIGYSSSLRRDGALVVCSCECHNAERSSDA